MTIINTNNPQWFKDHAAEYEGSKWVNSFDLMGWGVPPMAIGALIRPNGTIFAWIKEI